MSIDVAQLPYETWMDVINNYSSADVRAEYIEPARILVRTCPLLEVLPMIASNNVLSNVATRTDSLPSPGTRRFDEGVLPQASKNVPINDPISLFEDYSEVDKKKCDLQNSPRQWRTDQDMNHVEGFKQKLESELFYGSLTQDPGGFNGLSQRFNNLESLPNGLSDWPSNVWNNGATSGAVTSIWLVEFGKSKVYGIYPYNSPGGLKIEDLGETTKEFATSTAAGPSQNRLMQVYRTHLEWMIGLQVADERCVQRIANINPTPLSANNFDENVIIESAGYLPGHGEAPGTVMLVNRALKIQINIRATSQKLNAYYTQEKTTGDVWGARTITRFQGIPILEAEKISNYETVLT